MKTRTIQKSRAGWIAEIKRLQGVDAMLDGLAEDKRLLTFPEFFIGCLLVGNAECAKLKAMFPKLYKDLSFWLK